MLENLKLTKNNLKVIIMVLVISLLITLLIKGSTTALFILLSLLFLGLANGIYWFYVFVNKQVNKLICIVIIAFTWPILSILGTLTLVPVIVFDVFYILIKSRKNLSHIKLKLEESDMINEIKTYEKEKKISDIVLLLLLIILLVVILFVIPFPFISKILFSLSCIIIYFVLRNISHTRLQRKFEYIIYDNCDSESFYQIYKYLHGKYPKDYTTLLNYSAALRYNENDYSELKLMIRNCNQYKSHIFYLVSVFEVSDKELKKECFFELYKKAKPYNEKMYKKTGSVAWDSNVKFLEIENLLMQKNYNDALKICDSIQSENLKLNLVRKAFLKGICFMKLNKTEDAITAFDYVVNNGNTLRMKQQAINYIKELKQ